MSKKNEEWHKEDNGNEEAGGEADAEGDDAEEPTKSVSDAAQAAMTTLGAVAASQPATFTGPKDALSATIKSTLRGGSCYSSSEWNTHSVSPNFTGKESYDVRTTRYININGVSELQFNVQGKEMNFSNLDSFYMEHSDINGSTHTEMQVKAQGKGWKSFNWQDFQTSKTGKSKLGPKNPKKP